MPKLKSYALKFALLHHLLKEAERLSFMYEEELGHKIKPLVGSDSVEFGIELAHFFAGQTKKLLDAFAHKHTSFGLENVVAEIVLELYEESKKNVLAVKDITERVNTRLSTQYTPKHIGGILRRLGFTDDLRTRLHGGRWGVIISPTILSEIKNKVHQVHHIHPPYSPNDSTGELYGEGLKSSPLSEGVNGEHGEEASLKFTASKPHGPKLGELGEDGERTPNDSFPSDIPEEIWEEI